MSKQSSAWMPLYIGDYLGDTQRLTTEQHGAYLLLICDYWRNGPAPDDDTVLQQITKLDKASWKRHRAALSRLFQITEGEWRHKRIDRELSQAEENADRRTSKARAAAQARWGDAKSNAPSMPQALPVECPPPSPSPKKEEEEVSEADASAQRHPEISPDPEKVMFDSGRKLLAEAGIGKAQQGSLLGKWKRDHGAAAVIVALGKAQREGAIDPVSFITASLGAHNGHRTSNDRSGRGNDTSDAIFAARRRLGIDRS